CDDTDFSIRVAGANRSSTRAPRPGGARVHFAWTHGERNMSTYIQQWVLNGSNKTPEALAARQAFFDALVLRKSDQLRFDQSIYWTSVHGSWLHEDGVNQAAKAEAEGNLELAARI